MILLAMPYHDPNGSKTDELRKAIPIFNKIFDGIVAHVSDTTDTISQKILSENCTDVKTEPPCKDLINEIGRIRRELLSLCLSQSPESIFYCDGDRAVHWANNYPDELKSVVNNIHVSDFTVYGRTNRAWISHPESQKSTESIIDKQFANLTGLEWDVLAAARGISKNAAQFIVDCSEDDTFGVDVSWPILIQENSDRFSMSYVRVDGLSFEGENNDESINEWIHRAKIVQVELESMRW
jgi:hypothetical protein